MFSRYGIFAVMAIAFMVGVADAKPPQKIVRGRETMHGENSYTVSLTVNEMQFCSGAIISSRHIVTAAHCYYKFCNLCGVGRTKIEVATSYDGQIHVGKSITLHPFYRGIRASPNDIAIITLKTSIDIDDNIQPINLTSSLVLGGVTAIVSGWGSIRNDYKVIPKTVQNLDVEIISILDCATHYANVYGLKIHTTQICSYISPGYGSCTGDDGGPLVYNHQLVGVVSFQGISCGDDGHEVYTNVYYYVKFLQDVVNNRSNVTPITLVY